MTNNSTGRQHGKVICSMEGTTPENLIHEYQLYKCEFLAYLPFLFVCFFSFCKHIPNFTADLVVLDSLAGNYKTKSSNAIIIPDFIPFNTSPLAPEGNIAGASGTHVGSQHIRLVHKVSELPTGSPFYIQNIRETFMTLHLTILEWLQMICVSTLCSVTLTLSKKSLSVSCCLVVQHPLLPICLLIVTLDIKFSFYLKQFSANEQKEAIRNVVLQLSSRCPLFQESRSLPKMNGILNNLSDQRITPQLENIKIYYVVHKSINQKSNVFMKAADIKSIGPRRLRKRETLASERKNAEACGASESSWLVSDTEGGLGCLQCAVCAVSKLFPMTAQECAPAWANVPSSPACFLMQFHTGVKVAAAKGESSVVREKGGSYPEQHLSGVVAAFNENQKCVNIEASLRDTSIIVPQTLICNSLSMPKGLFFPCFTPSNDRNIMENKREKSEEP
eukprot:bmy_17527T0